MTKKFRRLSFAIIFLYFSGCMGLIDYPQNIGGHFYYLNHMVYYSNNGREQNIDSIFTSDVIDYTFDDNHIIIQSIKDSVVSAVYNETEQNAFVQTMVQDTVYWIIDKKSASKYGAFHYKDFNQACSDLSVSLSFD